MAGNLGAGSSAEQAGAAIASALILPHILATGIALLFNVLAWSMGRRGFALTSGIMYGVAMLLFPFYFMFVIIQMILTFVAFAKMKKE
ncbi:hypothetical protein [Erysipelothrix urinaevulpis]|nr:hypothetical protein [Erysipelothrix urinaevulpis]